MPTEKPDALVADQLERQLLELERLEPSSPVSSTGGYRRDHLRALAQRVEVADGEVRIMGSKFLPLQVLTGKTA